MEIAEESTIMPYCSDLTEEKECSCAATVFWLLD